MTEYPNEYEVINGECLDEMAKLPDNSIDAIVTVGIDMDEHYCEIADKRISSVFETVFSEVE